MNHQVPVDVNALKLSLEKEFNQSHIVSEERCIYRVPKRLRVLNEKVYTPRCVSIGPYHHGKDELKAMEEHKTVYLQHFLEYNTKVTIDKLILLVKNNETKLRNCYQERIDLSSERFVRLVLVDAVFVIMVLLRVFSDEYRKKDEFIFDKPWMIRDIGTDLILLENQLPFFILRELLSTLEFENVSMVHISSCFLNDYHQSWVAKSDEESFEPKHLVHFLSIGQQPPDYKHKELEVVSLPNAVDLHRAGVKFKPGSSQKLVDINFCNGILEIPALRITDDTEILFRNLLAFERTHLYTHERYFNDYITILCFLLTNGNDVEILTKEGIIENWLHGKEQVVHIFSNLDNGNDVNTDSFYFTDIVNDLNKYCRKRRNRWRAGLIQNYFYSPGAIISVIAAAAIILLTIIQTICSILQVKQQQS